MGAAHHYNPVNQIDDGKDEPQQQPIVIQRSTAWWKLFLCNFLAAAAGAGLMFAIVRSPTVTKHESNTSASAAITTSISSSSASIATSTSSSAFVEPTAGVEHVEMSDRKQNPLTGIILDCGYSPEEAREKGCVYDVMMQDWVPEPCYDSVLTEKFLAEGNYTWYSDGDGKTTMTDEQMRKGEHGHAWMSNGYHKDHCVFSWMKIIRALRNDRGISQELLSYDHVMHCAHGAMKEDSKDLALGVAAPTNYARCALYDTWLVDPIPDKHDSTSR